MVVLRAHSLGDNMLKCLTVGMTHWDNEVTAEDALGQAMLRDRTEFFFAPAHIQKRFKDWGLTAINTLFKTAVTLDK